MACEQRLPIAQPWAGSANVMSINCMGAPAGLGVCVAVGVDDAEGVGVAVGDNPMRGVATGDGTFPYRSCHAPRATSATVATTPAAMANE